MTEISSYSHVIQEMSSMFDGAPLAPRAASWPSCRDMAVRLREFGCNKTGPGRNTGGHRTQHTTPLTRHTMRHTHTPL